MEKYFGIQTSTLFLMISDLYAQWKETVTEMGEFPLDKFLPQRATRIQRDMNEIMDEIHNRNNV
jgi:hypothetical protein